MNLINDIKGLTLQNKIEHAVVKLSTGERAIVSGGPKSIEMEVKTIYAHVHPYHLTATGPSADDYIALYQLKQGFSYVLEHGKRYLIDLTDWDFNLNKAVKPPKESIILP